MSDVDFTKPVTGNWPLSLSASLEKLIFLCLLGIKISSESSRCEKEGQPGHLQGEVRKASNKTNLFSCSHQHDTPYSCGKTAHLSEEKTCHPDHMVKVLIRSTRWLKTHSPVHWGISCATWALSGGKERSDVFASAGLLCNQVIKPNVLMTECFFFFVFLFPDMMAVSS